MTYQEFDPQYFKIHWYGMLVLVFIKFLQNSQEYTCVGIFPFFFFFDNIVGLRFTTLLKQRHRHRCFSVTLYYIFKNIIFIEYLRATASVDHALKSIKTYSVQLNYFRSIYSLFINKFVILCFIRIRLFKLNFSLCYKYATLIMYIRISQVIYQIIYKEFRFHFVCCI